MLENYRGHHIEEIGVGTKGDLRRLGLDGTQWMNQIRQQAQGTPSWSSAFLLSCQCWQ